MPYKYNNFKINGGFSVKCECGVALIKTTELANKWGVSKDTLDYHTRKNGLPFTNAGYPVTASDVFYNKPLSLRKASKILGISIKETGKVCELTCVQAFIIQPK